MVSLLLLVFILQLVIHLINTVGAGAVNELLWMVYNKFPTPTSKAAQEQARLRREVFKTRQEMNATSSQDEFAKWARLRRQYDKQSAELQKKTASLQASKASFDRSFGVIRWVATTGMRFLLQLWYSRKPLLWIPQGWLPYYAEWLLSFPRAPMGSISIQVWNVACASVIALVSEAVVAFYALVVGKGKTTADEEPHKFQTAEKNQNPPRKEL